MTSVRKLVLALACLSMSSFAGQGPGTAGPMVLFDGKTLDGWKRAEFYQGGAPRVVDGTIVLPLGTPMSGVTCTREGLPTVDYELSYEAKRTAGSDFFAAATFPVGKSYITLVNGGWGGSVTGLSSLNGSDASENETNHFVKYADDTWYRFRVRVTSHVIRGWVGDPEIFAVDYRDVQVGTRIEVRANQPLGFSTWKSAGAVRNVVVRKLDPAEVVANEKIKE
jgi:hypothetical protein